MRHLSLALVALLLLPACGSGGDENGSDRSAGDSSPTTASPTPTPEPEPDADGDGVPDSEDAYPHNEMVSSKQEIVVECDGKRTISFTIDRVEPKWRKVWSVPLGKDPYCESYGPKLEPVSVAEQVLWDAVKRPDRYTIRIPYELCTEHGTTWTTDEWPVGEAQIREAEQALLLCPKHPDAAGIRSRIADLKQLRTDRKGGRAFDDGNFRVGQEIKPGTYYTENVADCYWERLDAAGNIIDNNFVLDALRVEVTVSPTDFSFHSQGCGTWRLA